MASLANLPKLRRTLTDVMEDELYHMPGQSKSNASSPQSQHPMLAGTRPGSNSVEFLTIPDNFTETHNEIMGNPTLIEDLDDDDEEMLLEEADLDDQGKLYTPNSFNIQPFNPFHDYANPNVFNSYNNQLHQSSYLHQDPFASSFEPPSTVSPRDAHLKFPEELLYAESNNALLNASFDPSQIFVWPSQDLISKNQIIGPEELYMDEISDDEDMEEEEEEESMGTDLNYYDVNDQTLSPPSSPSNLHQISSAKENSSPLSFSMEEILPLSQGNIDISSTKLNNEIVIDEEPGEDLYTTRSSAMMTPESPEELHNNTHRSIPRRKPSTLGVTTSDGFHQCHLINPATQKPCLKQFSRPYDLVRHQETIHASKKKIYRCTLCEDDFNKSGNARLSNKTFSRGDALSRHIRVKHGLTGNEANELIRLAKENVEYIDVA